MKKTALLAISLFLCVFMFNTTMAGDAAADKNDSGIKYYDYEEGLKKAQQDSLHVAVFFKTTWCKYCKVMDSTTMRDPEIVDLMNKYFVAVKVDGDKRKDLRKSYGVKGYPETWFLESNGDKIAPAPGYWPTEDFLLLLKYVGEEIYKDQEFLKWAETQKKTKG